MMSNVGLHISELGILLQILRYKLQAKLFKLEYKMIDFCGETISPQFGEYRYILRVGSKPKSILLWNQKRLPRK